MTEKCFKKRFLYVSSMLWFVGFLFSFFGSTKVLAATQKGYTILKSNTKVYSDTGLKKSLGWIYGSDEVTINSITAKYCYVTYPLTKGGTKSGYIATGSILTATGGNNKYATAKITTYRRASTEQKYGYIAKGDQVVVLGTQGKYTQVRYPVSKGYKFAFITTTDANKYLSGSKVKDPGTPVYAEYTGVNYQNAGLSAARVACLQKAQKLATVQWVCPADFPTWQSSKNVYNYVKATDGTSSAKFIAGKTYVGIPYSMANHSYDDEAWTKYVKAGFKTSDMQTSYAGRTCTTARGIDCSYLTYLCFQAAGTNVNVTYQETAKMLKSSYYTKKSLNTIKGGDIALKSGHVMLYVGRSGSKYAFFEADANDSKVSYNTYTASQLSGYGIYKFKGFTD